MIVVCCGYGMVSNHQKNAYFNSLGQSSSRERSMLVPRRSHRSHKVLVLPGSRQVCGFLFMVDGDFQSGGSAGGGAARGAARGVVWEVLRGGYHKSSRLVVLLCIVPCSLFPISASIVLHRFCIIGRGVRSCVGYLGPLYLISVFQCRRQVQFFWMKAFLVVFSRTCVVSLLARVLRPFTMSPGSLLVP
jgi:hypothetical protein